MRRGSPALALSLAGLAAAVAFPLLATKVTWQNAAILMLMTA